MNADIKILNNTINFIVIDYRCKCELCSLPYIEYSDYCTIIFVRKSGFIHSSFRAHYDAHPGVILISKPGTEYKVVHKHLTGDECTAISFKSSFYEQLISNLPKSSFFFGNHDQKTLRLFSNPHWDLLHNNLIGKIHDYNFVTRLQKETILNELVNSILSYITNHEISVGDGDEISSYNIEIIEQTKNFIAANFDQDLTLDQLAQQACKSSFHFSRLFKQYTDTSPYQYLLTYRLHMAAQLLKMTTTSVSDIGYQTGFNSKEHFSAAFTRFTKINPLKYRCASSLNSKIS